MSEPTYRVELTHEPASSPGCEWRSEVFRASDDQFITTFFRRSREAAFDAAQGYCRAKAQEPYDPSTVFLTEDGDILDPHEVQR